MTRIVVPVDPSFRFDLALLYLQRSPDEIIDLVRDGRHHRVITGAGSLALIAISLSNPGLLEVRLLAGSAGPERIEEAVRGLYPLADQPIEHIHDEPLAVRLHDSFLGLPVVQTLTPWEALVWAILGQQINIAFAYRLKRAFVEHFGDRIAFANKIYFGFPDPERVANLDHERDLLPLQFSRQKSRYIIEAARSVLRGDLDFAAISDMDDASASIALQRQLGVGRWTAEYILLRGYGRLDVIPAGDAALKMAVGQQLDLGRSATEDEVRQLAERWRPWRGQTAFMLWFAKQAGWF